MQLFQYLLISEVLTFVKNDKAHHRAELVNVIIYVYKIARLHF